MYIENLTLLILLVKQSNNNGHVLNIRVYKITTSVYTITMVNNKKQGSVARKKKKYTPTQIKRKGRPGRKKKQTEDNIVEVGIANNADFNHLMIHLMQL